MRGDPLARSRLLICASHKLMYMHARKKKIINGEKKDGRPVLDCPGAASRYDEFRSVVLKKFRPAASLAMQMRLFASQREASGRRHCNDFSDSIAMTTAVCVCDEF
jgi:hypothetical protein